MLRLTIALSLCTTLGLTSPSGARAQDNQPLRDMRGPRFLFVSSTTGMPVVADVMRTPILRQRLALELDGVTVKEALTVISQRTGLVIWYSDDIIRGAASVHLNAREITVAAALTDVLVDLGVDVVFSRDGAMLVPRSSTGASSQPPLPTGVVAGRVADANTGRSVAGASVTLDDGRRGADTDESGRYRIVNVPPGTYKISARRIGYAPLTQTVVVSEGGTATVDFALQPSATNLAQVVVTGTAGNQTRAAQSAVVASIDAAEVLSKAPVTSASELLQGRVPGLMVTTGSGTLGGASQFTIRGISSISLSNNPLVFIDGVRANTTNRSSVGETGGQQVSPFDDLNPNDIESIEVVKGPAAATLYGADASAGVIQIITKKGRLGAKHFTQNISAEYDNIHPNFTPDDVYGICGAAQVQAGGPAICRGLAAGAVVHNNPLVSAGFFKNGSLQSLSYDARGGGDNFSYFVSALVDNEQGTQVNNKVKRRTGRVNLSWVPSPQLSLNVNLGVSRNDYRLPVGDANSLSVLQAQAFSSPLGAFPVNMVGVQNIHTQNLTLRQTPTVQANYSPFSWFTNRLTLGGDFANIQDTQFFPKNNQNWYTGANANGAIYNTQDSPTIYTVDYLGNIKSQLRSSVTSDLSFGSQYINIVDNAIRGTGLGLTTNLSNLVGSAATTTATQAFTQTKQLGIFAQEQVSFGDRLFLQAALRADRNSVFGSSVGTFLEPKFGASYVISQESFWQRFEPVVSSLRLRAAYGTTGRSPSAGAALRTYVPFTYATDAGAAGSGFAAANPGNANLKPETGKEFETGLDAGFFHDRANLELTYYHKVSDNLLVQAPVAPSLGFPGSPFRNIGQVLNRGLEFMVRATPVNRRNFSWDVTFNGATNHNRIVSLGNTPAFFAGNTAQKLVPGLPVSAWYIPRILKVDEAAKVVYVSDTAQYAGNVTPTFTHSFSTTVTLFRNVRIYSLFDGATGAKIFNIPAFYADFLVGNSGRVKLPEGQGGYSARERLIRTGPYVSINSGAPQFFNGDPYIQSADFMRFRELSATLSLPTRLAQRFRATSASLQVGGRNLHLWKNKAFQGFDPEALGGGPAANGAGYINIDTWTTAQPRRFFTRLTLSF